MSDEKLKTWVAGLDDLLYGGIPRGSQVLIVGGPGTGKTLLSCEIIYHNAKAGVPGTFVCFDEPKKHLVEAFKGLFTEFDDFDELVETNTILFSDKRLNSLIKTQESLDSFISPINDLIKSNKSEVVVVDSISQLRPLCIDDREFTRFVGQIASNFSRLGVTGLYTLETHGISGKLAENDTEMLFGTSMFDGFISLETSKQSGSVEYLISVTKMRRSNHSKFARPYELTPGGITIFK